MNPAEKQETFRFLIADIKSVVHDYLQENQTNRISEVENEV